MSNLTQRRATMSTMVSAVKDLSKTKEDAEYSAKAAEQRYKALLAAKDTLAEEHAKATETLAVMQTERRGESAMWASQRTALEERIASLEASLAEERNAGASRDAAHAETNGTLQREHATLSGERASLQERLQVALGRVKDLKDANARLEATSSTHADSATVRQRELSAAQARISQLEIDLTEARHATEVR